MKLEQPKFPYIDLNKYFSDANWISLSMFNGYLLIENSKEFFDLLANYDLIKYKIEFCYIYVYYAPFFYNKDGRSNWIEREKFGHKEQILFQKNIVDLVDLDYFNNIENIVIKCSDNSTIKIDSLTLCNHFGSLIVEQAKQYKNNEIASKKRPKNNTDYEGLAIKKFIYLKYLLEDLGFSDTKSNDFIRDFLSTMGYYLEKNTRYLSNKLHEAKKAFPRP